MPIWEWKQLWHACHKYLWSKKSYNWSFILRSLSYYKVYHDCGATVSFMLTRTHHRRWPLVKGGLKIPCNVSVTEPGTCLNLLSLKRYKQLSEKLHIEAKKVTLLGSFLTPVQEPERQNTKILYNLYKKKHCLLNPNMVLFYFSSFLVCEKHIARKGFSKFLKKIYVFSFRDFQASNFSRLLFCESIQKPRNRESFFTPKCIRLR